MLTRNFVKGVLPLFCAFVSSVAAGAPFENLGFDEGTTNSVTFDGPYPGTGSGPLSDLLPGWDLFSGTSQLSRIGYNLITAGLNYASVYDSNIRQIGFPFPASGRFSLGLWPGPDLSGSGAHVQYTLSQVGDVPPDAKFIHFLDFGGPFELRFDGALIPLVFSADPNNVATPVDVYGDISSFAGQNVKLEFTTIDGKLGMNNIDDISFVVPEPASWLLLGVGGLVLLAGRRIFR